MGQCVNCDIERELLAVLGTDALSFVAAVVCAERTAQAIFAHNGDEVAVVEQALQLDVSRCVEAAQPINFVEGAVDQMVIGNGPYRLIWKNPTELAPPRPRKVRIGATPGCKKESAMCQVFPQVFNLLVRENEIVVAVHEKEWRFIKVRISQSHLALLLYAQC